MNQNPIKLDDGKSKVDCTHNKRPKQRYIKRYITSIVKIFNSIDDRFHLRMCV